STAPDPLCLHKKHTDSPEHAERSPVSVRSLREGRRQPDHAMTDHESQQNGGERPRLNEREAVILRSVVTRFIQTAAPVGSKVLAEQGVVDLSSASIRNTLSALESHG